MVGDDGVFAHAGAGIVTALALHANVHASGDVGTQFIAAVDELRHSFGLVGGQCVHRVYQHRLDAPVAESALLIAVVEYRVKEAFSFTRARACCHQCGFAGLDT